jgi:prepilin-type N-terminal cleavage/methylation domain-containing protein
MCAASALGYNVTLMLRHRKLARGVTLIEVMITVVIVGILATIAVVAYRKKIASSKITEATQIIQNIRAAQDAYKAETGGYADISSTITSFYPAASPGTFTTAWGAACANCKTNMDWTRINVQVTAPVQFGYATVAGDTANNPAAKGVAFSVDGTSVNLAALNGVAWYVVAAQGDTNGNGVPVNVYATSAGGDVMIDKEGE